MGINVLRVVGRYTGGLKADLDALDTHLLSSGKISSIDILALSSEGTEIKHQLRTLTTIRKNDLEGRFTRNLSPSSIVTSYRTIDDITDLKQFDIVYIHCPHLPIAIIASLIAWKKKIPVVLSYHGSKREHTLDNLAMRIFALLPKFIAERKLVLTDAGRYLLGEDSEIVPSFIDNGVFFRDNHATSGYFSDIMDRGNQQVVLYPARICPLKGQIDILLSVKILKEEGFSMPFRVVIAGNVDDSEYADMLRRKSLEYGLSKIIIIKSKIPYREMNAAYNDSYLQVFPTYEEGFGRIIVEAGLCGVPTVAYHVGGIPEIIKDGLNGYTVRKGDVRGLSSIVAHLLLNVPRRNLLGENAMSDFQNRYATQELVRRHIEVCCSVIN